MNRRSVLAALGSATAATATAGCIDGTDGDRIPTEDDGPGGTTEPTTTDPGTLEPGGPDDNFADEPCPSFSESERTVCYHTRDEAALYVEPSAAVFEPDAGADGTETIDFVLHNETGGRFGLNPYAWAIKRRTDEGWTHVAPEEYVEPWLTIENGGTYTWRLGGERETAADGDREQAIAVDLADGRYAFQVTGILGGETEDGSSVECVALFDVER